MSQEEEEIEQSESDKGKDNFDPSPPSVESNKQATTSEHTTYHCYKIEQPEKLYCGKFRMADLIQLEGVMLTFLALIVFVYVSTRQINIANKSIEQTDSSLAFNKRSIFASDSSTKEALRISDSSLAIAERGISISESNMVVSNAPYIKINIFKEILETGNPIKFRIDVYNVGRTPAVKFRSLIVFGISQ